VVLKKTRQEQYANWGVDRSRGLKLGIPKLMVLSIT
jgi:hypothetical protein